MADEITVTHNGVKITYRPEDNRWAFELRSRQRSSESLAKAREAIDKPVDEKEKVFTRIPIYLGSTYGNSKYVKAEVTAVAENSRFGSGKYVWVQENKQRSKKSVDSCFVLNEENASLVADITSLNEQITHLEQQRFEKQSKLQKIEV